MRAVTLADCLPAELRDATITKLAAGFSGASVYRVDAGGREFVLKIARPDEPLDVWQRNVAIRRAAADAGLTPRVVHADEARRAVVTAFVADRSFGAFYAASRDAALARLGDTLRRVHDLPLPAEMPAKDPRSLLAAPADAPGFVVDAIRGLLAEEPPAAARTVLSHNDVNPTNLVYDGENLLLVDWDAAGPNEPYYDVAAIAVFFRLDDDACKQVLAAHDGAPVSALPARFTYDRRLIAVICGAGFLQLARDTGHPGADVTLESAPALADFYQRLRGGAIDLASPDGRWAFGLALVKASLDLRRTG